MDSRPPHQSQRAPQRSRFNNIPSDLVQPKKPSRASYDKDVKQVEEELQPQFDRLNEIIEMLKTPLSTPELDELMNEQRTLRTQLREMKDSINVDKETFGDEKRALIERKKALTEQLRGYPHKDVESVTRALQQSEYELATAALTSDDRKRLMREIDQLKIAKRHVPELAAELEAVNAQLDVVSKQLDALKPKKTVQEDVWQQLKAVSDKIDTLRQEQKDKSTVITELKTERDQIRAQIAELKAKKQQLFESWKEQNNEFKKENDEYQRLRKIEVAQFEKERKKEAYLRDAKRLAEEPPFYEELMVCDTLLSYLNELKGGLAPPTGDQTGSKSKKKGKKSKKLSIDFESLSLFSQLKVAPPLSFDAVDTCLADVERIKSELSSKIEVVKTERMAKYQELLKKFEEEQQVAAPVETPSEVTA
ncbi:hypothetical protein GEMRC1_007745 [Eukaryota sp. GEM-RC1]